MKISTSLLFDRASSQMSTVQNKLANVQAQLSQGKQIIAPSDSPDQAAVITRFKGVIQRNDSYSNTLNTASARYQAEETTLQNVSDSLIRMRELGIQAANDTLSPVDRQAIALEMGGLRDQVMSLANTQDTGGTYLFSGSRVNQPAFGVDSTGAFVYNGDQTKVSVLVGDQRTVQLNRPGSEVFERVLRTNAEGHSEGVGFFQAMDDMVQAVQNSERSAMQIGLGELSAMTDSISLALAHVGTNMNVVDSQQTVIDETVLRLKSLLSNVEDLDFATAITQMNKDMLSLEAAQSSFSKITQLNLFNYIK
jgi:flagellar hook-associated protein 3 FlgL